MCACTCHGGLCDRRSGGQHPVPLVQNGSVCFNDRMECVIRSIKVSRPASGCTSRNAGEPLCLIACLSVHSDGPSCTWCVLQDLHHSCPCVSGHAHVFQVMPRFLHASVVKLGPLQLVCSIDTVMTAVVQPSSTDELQMCSPHSAGHH